MEAGLPDVHHRHQSSALPDTDAQAAALTHDCVQALLLSSIGFMVVERYANSRLAQQHVPSYTPHDAACSHVAACLVVVQAHTSWPRHARPCCPPLHGAHRSTTHLIALPRSNDTRNLVHSPSAWSQLDQQAVVLDFDDLPSHRGPQLQVACCHSLLVHHTWLQAENGQPVKGAAANDPGPHRLPHLEGLQGCMCCCFLEDCGEGGSGEGRGQEGSTAHDSVQVKTPPLRRHCKLKAGMPD